MIKIEHLSKKFHLRSKNVLNDITIDFEQGTYGLLGENGAGKTTLIRCITGMYSNYKGTISFDTNNKLIGYLPQSFGAFKELTVYEMMLFFANQKELKLKDISPIINEIIETVNLSDKLNTKVGRLSGGMVRRLGIAQALLGNPDVLVFDEPTAGLDPEERLRFKNVIEKVKKDKTIIISTHIVEDVEALCDKIAIVNEGTIVKCSKASEIKLIANSKVFEVPASKLPSISEPSEIIKQVQKDDELYYRVLAQGIDSNYLVEPTIEDGFLCAVKNI